jgi:16S rRNA processing protein RimM
MDWIQVGRLTRTHGLKGELKFFPTDKENLVVQSNQQILLGDTTFKIKSVRGAKSPFIIKFEGVDSIEAAQSLAPQEVLVAREDFESLPEGEYYRFEIEGLKVFDDTGKYYGVIEDIIETGSNDVYVVRENDREWLVPMIDSVVQSIDLEQGKLIFHCVEGLFEENPV